MCWVNFGYRGKINIFFCKFFHKYKTGTVTISGIEIVWNFVDWKYLQNKNWCVTNGIFCQYDGEKDMKNITEMV